MSTGQPLEDRRPPRILVSNDDGILSEGIAALAEAMGALGEVWVVAPDREQSAASHAISLHRPLRIREIRERWCSIDGTPTDCAYLAINHLMKDRKPALMVSGINHGPNLADDVTYSGTIAAAMESSRLGVPAIAFSLAARHTFRFGAAAKFATELARCVLEQRLAAPLLLNVNVPGEADPKGFSITRQGKHSYGDEVVEKLDPRGRKYYWIGGIGYEHEDIPGSDCNAVLQEHLISVTPLHLDLTEQKRLGQLSQWSVAGFDRLGGPL